MLPPDKLKVAVEEYKVIYKKQYGVDLSDQEATEQATKLLQLFEVITTKQQDTKDPK